MKKFIIGLALLSSASAFAQCDVQSAECYVGTYIGEARDFHTGKDIKCQVEISEDTSKEDNLTFSYTEPASGKNKLKESISSSLSEDAEYGYVKEDYEVLYALELRKHSRKENYFRVKMKIDTDNNLGTIALERYKKNLFLGILGQSYKLRICKNMVRVD